MLRFYIFSQYKPIKTDINQQGILMCPNYILYFKKKKKYVKSLTPLPPKVAPSHHIWFIHSPREPRMWVWIVGLVVNTHLSLFTFPASVAALWDTWVPKSPKQTLESQTELTKGCNTSFQLCLRFSLFSRASRTLRSTEQNCGSRSLYSLLMPCRRVGCVV